MGWSQNITAAYLNGHSTVNLTPSGGANSSVGFVSDPMFKLTPINEDTTFGMATVGFNAIIETKVIATAPGDITAALTSLYCSSVQIHGPNHQATLTNVFVAVTVQKAFGNKAGQSFIQLNAEYPGMDPLTAQSLVATAT